MDDIYKHKAEKYKYKYLKLKQELEGGFIYDGNKKCMYPLPIQNFDTKIEINNNEQLGQIENKLNIIIDYKIPSITGDETGDITGDEFNNINKKGYIGQIFKYDTYSQILQNLNILLKLNNPSIDLNYINIVFACTIFKEKRKKNIFNSGDNLIRTIFPKCDHILKKYVNEKLLGATKNKFGYIIYNYEDIDTKINYDNDNDNDTCNKCNNYNDKIPQNAEQKQKTIKKSLKKIRNAIVTFIQPLHEAGYVLNNIPEVTPDDYRSDSPYNLHLLYVDISKMTVMTYNNINNDIKHLIKLICHLLKRYFENDDVIITLIKENEDKINIDNLSNIITKILDYLNIYESHMREIDIDKKIIYRENMKKSLLNILD